MNKTKEIKRMNEASELEEKYRKLCLALDEGWKGLILDVVPTTSKIFFGNDTFKEREGYKVVVKLQSSNGEIFEQFFSLPDVRGILKSNLYGFEKKYNSVPMKGIEVDVILNDNGFFQIVI
jgi:hypothetical protein